MKVDRLPGWAFRRLTVEQREAFDVLRWRSPRPAERARLKQVLGWKRTREESVERALELLADGLGRKAVADELGVSDRHLRRLLADDGRGGSRPAESLPAKPLPMRPLADATCESGTGAQGARSRAPGAGFASFADLDAWLDEERVR